MFTLSQDILCRANCETMNKYVHSILVAKNATSFYIAEPLHNAITVGHDILLYQSVKMGTGAAFTRHKHLKLGSKSCRTSQRFHHINGHFSRGSGVGGR
jgi:hypothetical protein